MKAIKFLIIVVAIFGCRKDLSPVNVNVVSVDYKHPELPSDPFLREIYPHLVMHIPNKNLRVVAAAQAIVESDHGKSLLAKKGNNYFGMKCWRCKDYLLLVDDFGKKFKFKKFSSFEENLYFYLKVLSKDRYNDPVSSNTVEEVIDKITSGGYATNKRYPALLKSAIKNNRLKEIFL